MKTYKYELIDVSSPDQAIDEINKLGALGYKVHTVFKSGDLLPVTYLMELEENIAPAFKPYEEITTINIQGKITPPEYENLKERIESIKVS